MKLLLAGLLLCSTIANAQETMHIHIDKELYLPGEIIWFKTYIYSANQPSTSTNLYAGMYDEDGNLLSEKRFPIVDGTAYGDFKVNDSISADALQLFFFTKNMKRDSTGITRVVKIFNGKRTYISKPVTPAKIIAYPEGGNLIAGIVNKIILQATKDEKGLYVSGRLNETGSQEFIDSFQTNKNGIAELQFIPKAGSRYYISWKGNDMPAGEILLSAPLANGAVLRTDIAGNVLYYSIQKNNNLDRFNKLHLSLLTGNDVIYKESVSLLNNKGFVGNFKTDSFPSGVIDVHLTDDNNNLLQKKKIMINNPGININIVEKGLGPKGRNIIEVSAADTFLYNMSLSVTDANFDQGSSNSIYELLVPGANTTDNVTGVLPAKEMDVLLNSASSRSFSTKSENDNYLSLHIAMKDRKYTVPGNSLLDVIISDRGTGMQIYNLTPASGYGFTKPGLIFYDTAKIYYKVDNNKNLGEWLKAYVDDEKVPVKIPRLMITEIANEAEPSFSEDVVTNYSTKQASFNEMQVLRTVVIKGRRTNPVTKRLQELDDKYSTGMFRGLTKGYQLNAIDDPAIERSIDIISYIVYRFPGLRAGGRLGSRTIMNSASRGGSPLVFINENESPPEDLESITPSQLAYVKFIPGIVVGSAGSTADGALYIYTKRGDEPGERLPNMKEAYVKGYDISSEFLLPDHSGSNNSSDPDFRPTLYWNPFFITNKNNRKVQITYYNNDLAKKHLLILKGIAEDGSLVEIRKIIE